MKNLVLITLFLLFCGNTVFAQNEEINKNADDALKELEEGALTLRFADALTGKPIKGGKVMIKGVGDFESDFEGRVFFTTEEVNKKFFVRFTHKDYIETEFEMEVMAGTIFRNRYSISPKMPLGYLRVVLDWGETPRDLDAHLVKTNGYHISYRNMLVSADGTAKLDRDDTDGQGPETITATNVDQNGEYLFFVHDFTNQHSPSSTKLSNSAASVKVYGDNRLIQIFNITPDKQGVVWKVFKIVNGMVSPVNEMQ